MTDCQNSYCFFFQIKHFRKKIIKINAKANKLQTKFTRRNDKNGERFYWKYKIDFLVLMDSQIKRKYNKINE